MIKTNKSYSKRLKVTKNGKILSRKAGQNHFNSREKRRTQISVKKKMIPTAFSNKTKSRYLLVA